MKLTFTLLQSITGFLLQSTENSVDRKWWVWGLDFVQTALQFWVWQLLSTGGQAPPILPSQVRGNRQWIIFFWLENAAARAPSAVWYGCLSELRLLLLFCKVRTKIGKIFLGVFPSLEESVRSVFCGVISSSEQLDSDDGINIGGSAMSLQGSRELLNSLNPSVILKLYKLTSHPHCILCLALDRKATTSYCATPA